MTTGFIILKQSRERRLAIAQTNSGRLALTSDIVTALILPSKDEAEKALRTFRSYDIHEGRKLVGYYLIQEVYPEDYE